jgi:hypothetical protein
MIPQVKFLFTSEFPIAQQILTNPERWNSCFEREAVANVDEIER